jgi:hypothetical protein
MLFHLPFSPLNPLADDQDESLRSYKKSLGLSQGEPLPVDPSDKRTCVILSLALEVSAATTASSTNLNANEEFQCRARDVRTLLLTAHNRANSKT